MAHLHGIAHCVYVFCGSLHTVVYKDAAAYAKLKACCLGKGGVGSYAYGHNDHIGGNGRSIFNSNLYFAVFFCKALNSRAKHQPDTLIAGLAVDEGDHISVKGTHKLLESLNDGYLKTQFAEVFRHFHSDEAAAHDNCAAGRSAVNEILYAEGVLNGAEGENTGIIHAGDGRQGGFCAGREDELIVAFGEFIAAFKIFHLYGFGGSVYADNLVMHTHINAETAEKALGSLEGELFGIVYCSAYVIRETAVGVGYVARALENGYLCLFVKPAKSGSGACSACHTANDYNLHNVFLLSEKKIFTLSFSVRKPSLSIAKMAGEDFELRGCCASIQSLP